MRTAAEFRSIAREALSGKWGVAVLVGLAATLLGAVENMSPEVKINIDASSANASFQFAGQTIFSTGGGINSGIGLLLAGMFSYIISIVIVMGIAYFILGSIIEIGYARFNLKLVDRKNASLEDLFAYFSYWKTTVAARFLQTLYVVLWSVLLIIPGIMASYSYAMTEYILAENPELSSSEALSRSKEMMEGNRWRLFCLDISFIGWSFLCTLTFGIGSLWYIPYKQATIAAFYREVSGTEHRMLYYDY